MAWTYLGPQTDAASPAAAQPSLSYDQPSVEQPAGKPIDLTAPPAPPHQMSPDLYWDGKMVRRGKLDKQNISPESSVPPATGLELSPEADVLYGRVRRAEGTYNGDGFVIYGGKPFTPGAEHPGAAARVPGPQGPTSAAGPGQWEEGTWNGLKPVFRERFGRDPVFSDNTDQKAMTWINAGKVYPGGEAKLRADIEAGKLDTAALAKQWSGFGGGGGGWSVTGAGNWHVTPEAIGTEQARPDTDVVWMSPAEYKQMVQPGEEPEARSPSRSLNKSLAAGDHVQAVPELTVKDGRVVDQDGWRRAQAAEEAGVNQIPVAIRGMGGKPPTFLTDMRGNKRPFDFVPVPKAQPQAAPGMLERLTKGVSDIGQGVAQLAAHAGMAASTSGGMPEFGGFAGDTGEQAPLATKADIDRAITNLDADYEARRQAGGQTGTDWLRLAGNVAGTMPMAALGPGAEAGAFARIGAMLGMGAAGGAMMPTQGGDNFLAQKAQQAGLGAATGGVLGAGGEIASRIVAPAIAPAARRLLDAGVRLTPGQLLGGMAKGAEGRLTSIIPTASGAIRRSIEDFNRVAYDKVLAKIGKAYEGKTVGYDGIKAVEKQISTEYNKILPHVEFKADKQFVDDLQNLRDMASEMPIDEARQFAAILKNRVVRRMGAQGVMDGQTFKTVESELSQVSRDLHQSEVAGQRDLGRAIDTVNGMLRENLERQNPAVAAKLRNINGAWAAFTRIRDAASNRGKSLGIFTPADLLTAAKRGAGRRVFARGDALMQDLARDAEEVLPSNVPDSGTAGRLLIGEAFVGSGIGALLSHPEALIAMLGGTAAYTAPGVALMRNAAGAGLPATRNFLARAIRNTGQAVAPAAGAAFAAPSPQVPQP